MSRDASPTEPAVSQENHFMRDQLAQWRPHAWEDDISRNTLDTAPFQNGKPVAQQNVSGYNQLGRWLSPELLAGRSVAEMAARDTWPIPSPTDREGYLPGYDIAYWASGLADYIKVMAVAAEHAGSVESLYDFGAASGRVLRHFAVQSDIPELWASDINQRHVRWLCEFMPPHVKAFANHALPCLPMAAESIDVICAFSVFTHIDTFETAWLAELYRILRPGGLAYLTVHDEATWRRLADGDASNSRVVSTIQSCSNYRPGDFERPLPEGRTVFRYTTLGPYRGLVFHSRSYLDSVWGRYFQVIDVLAGHHQRQSVALLRKPAARAARQLRAA